MVVWGNEVHDTQSQESVPDGIQKKMATTTRCARSCSQCVDLNQKAYDTMWHPSYTIKPPFSATTKKHNGSAPSVVLSRGDKKSDRLLFFAA